MGNRALIMALDSKGQLDEIAIYLHWDGSPNQVKAFLAYCKMMKYRSPDWDSYGWAQLIKTIGNFIDENEKSNGLSIGVCSVSDAWRGLKQKPGTLNKKVLDAVSLGDNGVYLITDWRIVYHHCGYPEDEMTPDILRGLLCEINEYQPYHLPNEIIDEFVKKESSNYIE